MRKAVIVLVLCMVELANHGPASADSVDEEAQTLCSQKEGKFEIRPFLLGGDTSVPEAGFVRVENSSSVACRVRGNVVTAQIAIAPPSTYHCAGAGYAVLKSLQLGKRELLSKDVEIGTSRAECVSIESGVFDRLSKLDVVVGTLNVELEVCTARGPSSAKPSETCSSQRYVLPNRSNKGKSP